MSKEPLYVTVKEIIQNGPDAFEKQAITRCHLFYSSPATLQYNSPGAYGFCVKRAGLVLPESVMLLVAPGCCGRNSAIVGSRAGYSGRMFYLKMDETDLVTGRHLNRIPEACLEILNTVTPKPKAILICITCVDALLGTDLDRICKKAEQECGIHIVPTYMYAINREGKKPPMVAIRQALYSLLRPAEVNENSINILGNFSPLEDACELPILLKQAGFDRVNEISACRTFDEYMKMGGARFNLVINPESRYAAEDLRQRLGIPYGELTRLYSIDKIKKQYSLFGAALGLKFNDNVYYDEAADLLKHFIAKYKGLRFIVGQMINADPFELSLALVNYGFAVPTVIANISAEDYPYIKALSKLSTETRIYSSLSPSMINFNSNIVPVDITIGRDAGYYFPGALNVAWDRERQPFGYHGLTTLIREMEIALDKHQNICESTVLAHNVPAAQSLQVTERYGY